MTSTAPVTALVVVDGRVLRLHVMELGLACCGLEMRQARRSGLLDRLAGSPGLAPVAEPAGLPATGVPGGPGGVALEVLVVAGTVTTLLADAVREAHAALPEPRAVLAFGACAATGGPYWDSYAVVPGAHEIVPVDVWVPGCPPRPADLVEGLREVLRAAA